MRKLNKLFAAFLRRIIAIFAAYLTPTLGIKKLFDGFEGKWQDTKQGRRSANDELKGITLKNHSH